MAKDLKFDLTVGANALLQANPIEFYTKMYGVESASKYYRNLAGIKNKTKIATVLFSDLTKAAGCKFAPTNSSVDAIDIDVESLTLQTSLCQYQLEQSWLADEMAKGSNTDFTVASFMTYFWGVMAMKASEEVGLMRWRGNKAGATGTYLDLVNGHNVALLADTTVIDVLAVAITSANVVAQMTSVLEALIASDENLGTDRSKLLFYMTPAIAMNFRLAAAQGNTQSFVTTSLALTFLDIEIVVDSGMKSGEMLLTRKDNLIYAYDAEGDKDQIQIVDFSKSTLDREIGARADFKLGFWHVNGKEIAYYHA